jgi:ribosome-associated protein
MAQQARDVPIRDESIRLGQFLKLADLIDSGSDARAAISAGEVAVNGDVELRRGRQLHPGDTVSIRGHAARVTAE